MKKAHLLKKVAERVLGINKGSPVLVAIDGVDGAGKSRFSEELLKVISDQTERLILLSSTDYFHNSREHRFVEGKQLHESFYENSFNYEALKDKLLDPLKHETKDYWDFSIFLDISGYFWIVILRSLISVCVLEMEGVRTLKISLMKDITKDSYCILI